MGYIFLRPTASTTFRLHELQGGTTSFGDGCLRSPPSLRLGSRLFQRFTARRASFGTVLVMNSQGFADLPVSLREPTRSQPRFSVSPAERLPHTPKGVTGPSSGLRFRRVRRRDFSVYLSFSSKLGVFIPFGCRHPSFFLFSVPPSRGWDSVGASAFALALLLLLLSCERKRRIPLFSDPI